MSRIAVFVSPHGFGHAARSCATASELAVALPDVRLEILSTVPKWFFADSLEPPFAYHAVECDVGLVQRSPLVEDLAATAAALEKAPFLRPEAVRKAASTLERLRVQLVIADISPLGLAAAAVAGLPSVLVENFTWDWIYANYRDAPAGLRRVGRSLEPIFEGADLRIQAEPVCARRRDVVSVPPIARRTQRSRAAVRRHLGIDDSAPMVVVSMGGVPWDYGRLQWRPGPSSPWVVVPGGSEGGPQTRGRVLLLPFRAQVFHPDLVAAADVVVSKLGYSTVAEAAVAGISLAYLPRPRFPESPELASWVCQHMNAAEISEGSLEDGSWLDAVERLIEDRPDRPACGNGAAAAARAIVETFPEILAR